MPVFRYRAVAANGEIINGEVEAPSRSSAIARLQGSGHLPISAEEINSGRNPLEILASMRRRQNRVRHKDIVLLTRELATLLHAGLPLDHALRMLEQGSASEALKDLLHLILQKVQGGAALSSAMAEHPGVFSRLYLNTVRAGEAGGSMQTVIERMADYLERMDELRSTIITAMLYPAILLLISLSSLVILMTFVVPQFIPLFEDAGQTLPLITRVIFDISVLFRHYWWVLIALIGISAWIAGRRLDDSERRLRFDSWLLRLPTAGTLIVQMEIARLARTLSTLLMNGVPVIAAVNLIRDVIGNRALIQVMESVAAGLEQGQRLARPLKESGLFPPLAVQLIEVGEESGQLEMMLARIADIYDKEVKSTIKRLLTLLEPVIILLLGGVIAIIILSILLAILGLNDLIA